MITVKELRKWLDTLEPDDVVGIDEGGLTMELVCEEAEASEDDSCYIEIGGMPDDNEE